MEFIQSQCCALRGVIYSCQGGRSENQDDVGFTDTPLGFLLVLCDGMGGGPGGRTASFVAKMQMARFLCTCSPTQSRIDALKEAVSRTNEVLCDMIQQSPALTGMGTTLVAMLINPDSAVIAHLGDSRCYRVRNGRVLFRTNDHSLVGELVRNGALTEEQARRSPQANVISRGLGSVSNNVPEIDEVPYRTGDRFVICTDGVWGIMPHEDVVARIADPMDMSQLANNLSQEIDRIGFAAGGFHDNHTLAIIEMDNDSIMKDKMSRTAKIILGILAVLLAVSMVLNVALGVKLLSSIREDDNRINVLQENRTELLTLVQSFSDEELKRHFVESEEQIAILQHKVDSLEQLVEQGDDEDKLKKIEEVQTVLQKIHNSLNSMQTKEAKEKELREFLKAKISEVNTLISRVDELTDSAYADTVRAIRTDVNSEDIFKGLGKDRRTNKCRANKRVKDLLGRQINRTDWIKEQIK